MTTPDPAEGPKDPWSDPDSPVEATPGWGEPHPSPYHHIGGHPPHGVPIPQPSGTNARLALIITIVAVVLLCACVGGVAGILIWGRDALDGARSQQTVGLGQPVRDGNLEFRVRHVQCGVTSIGDEFVSQIAIGQFCLVEIVIHNVGNRPATFSDALQRAYGPSGAQYGADSGAGVLANTQVPLVPRELNPGNQVTGIVVYDIPPEARITRLELRESATSEGALVRTG